MGRFGEILFGIAMGLLLSGCADGSPTMPEADSNPTVLTIEPSAPIALSDSNGMAAISVFPHQVGGGLTIEVCSDEDGRPLVADFSSDVTSAECGAAGGTWSAATDLRGRTWSARTWEGPALLRFARGPGQSPLLFRASYQAPNGASDRDVSDCPWVLADGRDVGVRCTSTGEFRLLPNVLPASGANPAN